MQVREQLQPVSFLHLFLFSDSSYPLHKRLVGKKFGLALMAKKENPAPVVASNPGGPAPYPVTQLSRTPYMHNASLYSPDACPKKQTPNLLKDVLTNKK
jgi:hypothetical protein